MSAPARIRIEGKRAGAMSISALSGGVVGPGEYVRADIADEMMEALKAALHELDYAYSGAPHFAQISKTKARAAIAKAEGRPDG